MAADSASPGEYAADEGGRAALFALLEGRIEAVSLAEGIERVVGERHPGDIFGEVPITLGTVFPVGFRAAEKSRVMQVEAHDYHRVAAEHPQVARRSASSRATDRRPGTAAGPGGRAARSPGDRRRRPRDGSCATWGASSSATRSTFDWLPPDAPEAERARSSGAAAGGRGLPGGRRIVDGETVVRPELRRWPSCSTSAPSPTRPSTTR